MKIIQDLTDVNYTPGNSGREYIVLHYTGNETDTAKANATWFRNVNRGASAHYFVDQTSIYQVVSDQNTAWAVGRNYGANNLFGQCTNGNSLSIEMCSTRGRIADETLRHTTELTRTLMKKYGIPVDRVVRHWDVCSKECPGWSGWLPPNDYIWQQFKKSLTNDTREEMEEMSECYIKDGSKIYYFNYATKVLYHVPNPNCLSFMQQITKDGGAALKTYTHSDKAPYLSVAKQIIAAK